MLIESERFGSTMVESEEAMWAKVLEVQSMEGGNSKERDRKFVGGRR